MNYCLIMALKYIEILQSITILQYILQYNLKYYNITNITIKFRLVLTHILGFQNDIIHWNIFHFIFFQVAGCSWFFNVYQFSL